MRLWTTRLFPAALAGACIAACADPAGGESGPESTGDSNSSAEGSAGTEGGSATSTETDGGSDTDEGSTSGSETGETGDPPPSLVVRIDPADPHRLVRGDDPFFVAGYYGGGASWGMAGVGFGGDVSGRVRENLDLAADQGINYMRVWLDWGSTTDPNKSPDVFWNSAAVAPYLRTGPGHAIDGQPKYDLDQFNDDYFTHVGQLVDDADERGIVVQAMLLDCWHTGFGLNSGYGAFDYFRAQNNINGFDWSTHEQWVDPNGSIYAHNLAFVHRMVEEIGDRENVVWETCNEKKAGNSSDPVANAMDGFHAGIADAIHEAEDEFGFERHLVVPVDFPEHRTIAGHWLPTQGNGNEESLTSMHDRLANEQFGWGRVLITDNDCCVGEPNADVLRRKAWIALASGAHTMGFNNEIFRNAILDNQNTANGMRFIGYTRDFVESLGVDLVGMEPHDELVDAGAYALARPGEEWVIYVPAGAGTVTVQGVPASATATWYDTQSGQTQDAGEGPSYAAPGGGDWGLHVVAP
jgi:hypothetical protein